MRQGLLIVAFVCLLLGIPFIHQAYTIDDPTFVAVAKHLQRRPTGLIDFRYDHLGERVEHYILEMTHPPLWPYMLAGAYEIVQGEMEEVSHGLTIFMAAIAGMGLFLLAGRLGVHPMTAAMVLVTTPAFLVLSHTVMSEIASLAFATTGVWLFLRYRDRPGWSSGLLAAAVLTCAVGVAYQNAVLVAVVAISSPRSRWYPLLLPAIALAAWMLLPWAAGAESPLTSGLAPYLGVVARNPIDWFPIKAACLLAYIGLCPFFLAAALPSLRSRRGQVAAAALFLAGGGIYLWGEVGPTALATILFGLLFAGGAGAAILATRQGWEKARVQGDPDSRLLLGWFWGYLLFSIFFLNFAAVRHTVIMLPPVILLLLRRPPGVIATRVGIGASLVVGLLLSVADARFAEAGRTLPEDALQALEPVTARRHEIRVAGEWGFRFYLEEENLRYFAVEEGSPIPGEWLLVPDQTASVELPPEQKALVALVEEIPVHDGFPVRLMMNSGPRAGFYCHAWGMLPFTITTRPIETLRIYEVNWFLATIEKARIPEEGGLNPLAPDARVISAGGDLRASLFLHSPGEIGYRYWIPHIASLMFHVGIPEAAWEQGGDGVEFEVSIVPIRGRLRRRAGERTHALHLVPTPLIDESVKIYSRYLDPRNRPEDRGWHAEQIDLSGLGQSHYEIVFKTHPGPAGDSSYDWAAWGNPRIVRTGD